MRFSLLALTATLAAFTHGQFAGLPSCADPCVNDFVSGSTIAGCNSVDISCICSNSSFLSSIACCLAARCSPADQQAATQYALNLCETNGVTNLPSSVSCASTVSSTGTNSPTVLPTSANATISATPTLASHSSSSPSPVSSSTTAAKNAGPQNVAGVGAGILGGLVAVLL